MYNDDGEFDWGKWLHEYNCGYLVEEALAVAAEYAEYWNSWRGWFWMLMPNFIVMFIMYLFIWLRNIGLI